MALIVVKRNFPQPLRAAGLCQGLRKCEPIRAQTPRMSLKFWQCPSPAIELTRYRHNCDYSDVNRLAIGKAPRPGGKGRTCCDSAPSVASLPQRPRRTDSAKRLRVWAGFRVASAHSNARTSASVQTGKPGWALRFGSLAKSHAIGHGWRVWLWPLIHTRIAIINLERLRKTCPSGWDRRALLDTTTTLHVAI